MAVRPTAVAAVHAPDRRQVAALRRVSRWMTHGDENGMGIMIGRLSTRPGEGTHAVVDLSDYDETPADVIFAVFIYQQGQNLGTFVSTGGELTITQSSANRMQGTFQLLAAGTLMEGGEVRDVTVVISGSSDAGAA